MKRTGILFELPWASVSCHHFPFNHQHFLCMICMRVEYLFPNLSSSVVFMEEGYDSTI